ncbi:hypothetical protein VNO80_10506 [Phaseolus coccineus]|uniref:Uncharacterized protein n=1 Tax=Phaseolus coccineus TaxID=3886 RepID=A0AAN9RAI5_PHACN
MFTLVKAISAKDVESFELTMFHEIVAYSEGDKMIMAMHMPFTLQGSALGFRVEIEFFAEFCLKLEALMVLRVQLKRVSSQFVDSLLHWLISEARSLPHR